MSPDPTTTDHEIEDHDRGLAFDLSNLMNRRRALSLLAAGASAAALVACGSSSDGASSATTATTAAGGASTATTVAASATTTAAAATEIPEETAGPYPGDGSNGPNVLTESGIVRKDITTSFGDLSGTAEGVPTTIELTLIDVAGGGTPLAGAAVYVWHCAQGGGYSLYSEGVTDQNYLRGVQESGADGKVTFTSIYPAAYDGRWPHIHFEVYQDLATATAAGSKLKTSQVALPKAMCDAVYATDGYSASIANLARTSLDTDMVFSDGYASELATATGSVTDGVTVSLNVGV